jgi:hypothetical protein
MEAASAAISPLGFVLDLMLQRVLTCMRKRSAMWVTALARSWPELEAGWVHAGARRSQESYGGGKATAVEMRVTGGR